MSRGVLAKHLPAAGIESGANGALQFRNREAATGRVWRALAKRRPDTLPLLPSYGAVRIVSDEGDVVRVSSDLGQEPPFEPLDPGLAIEAWVSKAALLPVLRRRFSRVFADGTGFVSGLNINEA